MFQQYKFRRLLFRNFRSMLLFLLPILFLMLLFLGFQTKNIHQKWTEENTAQLAKTAAEMDSLLSTVSSNILESSYRSEIFSFFSLDRPEFSSQYILSFRNLKLHLKLISAYTSEIDNVFLYCESPEYYVNLNSAMSIPGGAFDWDAQVTYPYPFATLVGLHDASAKSQWLTKEGILYYYQPLNVSHPSGGFLLRFSNYNVTKRMTQFLSSSEMQCFLLNEDAQVLASSDSMKVGSLFEHDLSSSRILESGITYAVFLQPSTQGGYQYVLLSPMSSFWNTQLTSLLVLLVLSLLFVLFCLLLTYRISKKTIAPYELILELLRIPSLSAQERQSLYESKYARLDDLGMISTLIFQSHNQKATLQSQLSTQQDLVRIAQRKALQAQINPHFLINTLEGIKWKLMETMPENQEIPSMISSLAQLLKANLELNSPLTTIENELHQAKLYLQIQQFRFEDLFEVTWDVDPALLSFKTIRFSLQPLLENAINHGIKKAGRGTLFISVHEIDDQIRFVIHDSGKGIEPQTLEVLQRSLMDSQDTRDSHIGLTNVNARLQLIFGHDRRLQIHSRPTEGTTVTMDIPKSIPSDMPGWVYDDLGL